MVAYLFLLIFKIMPARNKINLLVILLVGMGMPAYYKIKFLILEIITPGDVFNKWLALEILFGITLAAFVVCSHDWVARLLRSQMVSTSYNLSRFLIQYLISTAAAIAMAMLYAWIFWDLIMRMPLTNEFLFDYALLGLVIPLFVNGVFESLFFYGRWEKVSAEKEQIEKENIRAKYEALQHQISPHFLFNCFNTLNVLIAESKQLAIDFLQQLSKVYRYVLEVKNQEMVHLKTELSALQSYASLMRHRFGESFRIQINSQGSNDRYLAPLTLQMLMENALKHNQCSDQSPLEISIQCDENHLTFSNPIRELKSPSAGTQTGLENLSQRYRLLVGEDIKVQKNTAIFCVQIPLTEIRKA